MANIRYLGKSDIRELEAADLKKADVSGFKKTSFRKGESVEVSDEVATALLDNPALFGKFEKVESKDEAPATEPELLDDQTVTSTAASQEEVADSGPGSTTRG